MLQAADRAVLSSSQIHTQSPYFVILSPAPTAKAFPHGVGENAAPKEGTQRL